MNRVFITGLGIISPIGDNVEEFWDSLLNESRTADLGFQQYADRIENRFIYTCPLSEHEKTIDGKAGQLAMEAVKQAIDDAALDTQKQMNCGISIGTTMGDESLIEDSRDSAVLENKKSAFPFQLSASIASHFNLCGPNSTISNACTSGLYGIDLAASAIRHGEADLMLAGGVESSSRIVLSCFNRLGALDQGVCRPFDQDRQGTVLAEGAAFVVLESEESMKKRGRTEYYTEYKSSGWSCDAYQATAPEPSGEQIKRALKKSITASGITADDIGCILPHGTGTPLNDSIEASVLGDVFGDDRQRPIVTAIKSKLGHSGGASGAFSIVTACMILKYGNIPPTANLKNKIANFDFHIPVDTPLKHVVNNVLVNAYAFGGNNISVVVGQ